MASESNEQPELASELRWAAAGAKRDYDDLPEAIKDAFGYDLWLLQIGDEPESSKTLKGFSGASVAELIDSDKAGTYRAVYTVKFPGAVYVLHAFQKKSTHGIATSKQDLDLIRQRLADAEADYKRRQEAQKGQGKVK